MIKCKLCRNQVDEMTKWKRTAQCFVGLMKGHGLRFILITAVLLFSYGGVRADVFRVECGLPIGANCAVQSVVAKHWPGASKMELRHSQTLTKSALLLAAGRLEAAVFLPASFTKMQAGEGVYAVAPEKAKAAAKNLRSLFSFVDGFNHILADASTKGGMRETIEGKKIFIGPPSGSLLVAARVVLQSSTGGLEMGVDFEPVTMGWGAGQQAFAAGKIDVFVRPMPAGLSLIKGLSKYRKLRLVGLSEEEIARMQVAGVFRFPGFTIGEIPGDTYPEIVNSGETVKALAYSLVQTVNVAMSEQDAYEITAAFWGSIEAEKTLNPALATIDPTAPFPGLNVPLHPGAERYYREQGIQIPENISPR